ncbi:hypothetical protein SEA_SIXAMA_96 [Gordonia phage Sixama]|uniref:Uncharacterized protein n=1 Tax=Gordonia phage Sixama TaxID=2653271 RepID=A0A5Q2F740_9CAUD|nr:hypothetical protein PP302_gp096 [Gordonia phage Sixama]QGF20275.1 hypothetical protein SEA_SIXAMA_96 [Gordonia phage Sixama]
MKVDRDVEKVLDKADAIVTNAGYQILDKKNKRQGPSQDDYVYALTDDGAVEFDVSPTNDMGLPEGLRETPLG